MEKYVPPFLTIIDDIKTQQLFDEQIEVANKENIPVLTEEKIVAIDSLFPKDSFTKWLADNYQRIDSPLISEHRKFLTKFYSSEKRNNIGKHTPYQSPTKHKKSVKQSKKVKQKIAAKSKRINRK